MQFGRQYEDGPRLRVGEWLGADGNIPDARALRGVALGRKNDPLADAGGERAAAIYSLIETAKLNGIDPPARLPDVIPRIGHIRDATSSVCCPTTGNLHPEQRSAPDAQEAPAYDPTAEDDKEILR